MTERLEVLSFRLPDTRQKFYRSLGTCRVCRMHGANGGAPGKMNGNYRHGTRTKEAIQAARYVNLLSRLAQKS
jgi:hypothetical protein